MRRFLNYWKYYFEPDYKLVKQLAYESSCQHFKNVFCPTIDEQLAYQRAYAIQFRHNYAKNRLSAEVLQ